VVLVALLIMVVVEVLVDIELAQHQSAQGQQ
jgi:hypothetical protein